VPYKRREVEDLRGAPPELKRLKHYDDFEPREHAASVTSKRPGRINLKHVAEALLDEGLDPAAEIARVLTEKVPARDRQGMTVVDENGEPVMIDAVDPDTRLRVLNEMLQYIQPKLKAVEVKMSGNLELSSEQLDQRLQTLLAKAAKA
jgi:hypothetical protein